MSVIFINGVNAKSGGGRSILTNLLKLLAEPSSENRYIALVPEKSGFAAFGGKSLEIIQAPKLFRFNATLPFLYRYLLPRLIVRHQADLLFNLADLIVPTDIPQIYLFDWSYAVYPDSIAWRRMDFFSRLKRRLKLHFFKKHISKPLVIIAQTETMKSRLKSIYGLTNIVTIPNPVSLENLDRGSVFDFALPKGKSKLLYLAHYYPHKNIEILVPLAELIRTRSLPYCLVITISENQHPGARRLLREIAAKGLGQVLVNVGPVPGDRLASLYDQTDAILMPTLLESLSGSYVEAMYHRKTILTSDFDFARDICGEAAFYFDPLSSESILASIESALGNSDDRSRKLDKGSARLEEFLNWEQVFSKYQALMLRCLSTLRAAAARDEHSASSAERS